MGHSTAVARCRGGSAGWRASRLPPGGQGSGFARFRACAPGKFPAAWGRRCHQLTAGLPRQWSSRWLSEQDGQGLGPVAGRWRRRGPLLGLAGMPRVVRHDPADQVFLAGSEVDLRGRQLGVAEDQLDVGYL